MSLLLRPGTSATYKSHEDPITRRAAGRRARPRFQELREFLARELS